MMETEIILGFAWDREADSANCAMSETFIELSDLERIDFLDTVGSMIDEMRAASRRAYYTTYGHPPPNEDPPAPVVPIRGSDGDAA